MNRFFLLCLGAILLGACNTESPKKLAFVNNMEVFEKFDGKIELEKRHKKDGLQKQQVLDSMKVQLIAMKQSENTVPEKVANYEQQYMRLMNQFKGEVQERNNQYTNEVWQQINQYILDYGNEHDYDYIFGSAGNGSLMYAKEAEDITNEVVQYINKKYSGE